MSLRLEQLWWAHVECVQWKALRLQWLHNNSLYAELRCWCFQPNTSTHPLLFTLLTFSYACSEVCIVLHKTARLNCASTWLHLQLSLSFPSAALVFERWILPFSSSMLPWLHIQTWLEWCCCCCCCCWKWNDLRQKSSKTNSLLHNGLCCAAELLTAQDRPASSN